MLGRVLGNRQTAMTQHHVAQFVSNRAVAAHNSLPYLDEIPVGERYPLTKNASRERCVLDVHHPAVRARPAMCDINHRALPPDSRGEHLVHRSNNRAVTASIALCKPHEH